MHSEQAGKPVQQDTKSNIPLGHKCVPVMSSSVTIKQGLRESSILRNPQGPTRILNIETLVANTVNLSIRRCGAKAPIVKPLIESLIWIFVARRSLKKDPFPGKELQKFRNSIEKTARRICFHVNDQQEELDYLKYWLNVFLCRLFRDERLPDMDKPTFAVPLFSGWCKKCINRGVLKRDASLLYSFGKGSKQAWPKLGKEREAKTLEKHLDRFTKPHGLLPNDIKEHLIKMATKMFGSIGPEELTKFSPSTNACLEAPRKNGGALSLCSECTFPEASTCAAVGKLPAIVQTINNWRELEYAGIVTNLRTRILDESVEELDPKTGQAVNGALQLTVMTLPEPGKFRVLTIGDGYLYTALQPLQGALIDRWKHHPASTMLKEDLEHYVQCIDVELHAEEDLWYSVDYEAATDLIKKDGTMAVLKAISSSCSLGNYLRDIAEWAMGSPNLAYYPHIGEYRLAIDGQPMGHPLSFPILCVINLAVFETACVRWLNASTTKREQDRRVAKTLIMRKNVLVNGDDMLFKAERSFGEIFEATALEAGLKTSVGKSYISKDTCMINSQIFQRNRHGVMRRCGYLNQNILNGVVVKNGVSDATPTQLGRELNTMVHYCAWSSSVIPHVFNRFLKDFHGKDVKPNWYLPVHLGGYGLDPNLAPESWRVTRDQRLLAARFINDTRLQLYTRMGKRNPIKMTELAHATLNYHLVGGDYVMEEHETEADRDPWLLRLAYFGQIMSGSHPVSEETIVRRFKSEYRLKPCAPQTLVAYWKQRLISRPGPFCPPIGLLPAPFINMY